MPELPEVETTVRGLSRVIKGRRIERVEARRPDGESGVYLASASTQIVRKLFTYSPQFAPPELAVSADGRQLVYLLWESVPPAVLTMDVSAPRVR